MATKRKKCSVCNGSGKAPFSFSNFEKQGRSLPAQGLPGRWKSCWNCHGNGYILVNAPKKSKKESKATKRCFIATSVYESPNAPEVVILPDFRDRVLERNPLRRAFVTLYYYVSPGVASLIHRHSHFRNFIRLFFLHPLVSVVSRLPPPGKSDA